MKRMILLTVFSVLLLSSCLSSEYSESYAFGTRISVSFSEVTSSQTPELKQLSSILTSMLEEAQTAYQFNFTEVGNGDTQSACISSAVSAAQYYFDTKVTRAFEADMENFGITFNGLKNSAAAELATESGSVVMTLYVFLIGDDAVMEGREEGAVLGRTASYTFSCKGSSDTY